MDDEARFKEQLHAQWQTPAPVITQCVRRAGGGTVANRTRIIGGENNEVWSVTTATGAEFIVRVSHTGGYAAERWAAERARAAGVPAPEVLWTDDAVEAAGKRVAVWVQRKIAGHSLEAVRDPDQARQLTRAAGQRLARIHSVPVSGNGALDGSGRGDRAGFADVLVWDERALNAAQARGIPAGDLGWAAELMAQTGAIWAASPRLLHGDWLPEHILVCDGTVTGVIDFGGARGGDPAYDFAYWQFFWDNERFPLAQLIEGYRREGDLGDRFELRFHLCRL
ncbi:MAG TPA: aminoglycoside phosphotransferase family protein, partial [Limnochordia bacterium]|nr:aminoglycoside phosphotransferase family protein [Limnochordia bacterium]